MDREEFEKLKAAEKEHLLKMKALKAKLADVKRRKKLLDAVEKIKPSTESDDTYQEMMDRLQMETIEGQVKLEMAMDSARESQPAVSPETEEQLQKAKAKQLVEQMKLQMGGFIESEPKEISTDDSATEKSIGRKPISEEPETSPEAAEGEPEKTIGRRRKT